MSIQNCTFKTSKILLNELKENCDKCPYQVITKHCFFGADCQQRSPPDRGLENWKQMSARKLMHRWKSKCQKVIVVNQAIEGGLTYNMEEYIQITFSILYLSGLVMATITGLVSSNLLMVVDLILHRTLWEKHTKITLVIEDWNQTKQTNKPYKLLTKCFYFVASLSSNMITSPGHSLT